MNVSDLEKELLWLHEGDFNDSIVVSIDILAR